MARVTPLATYYATAVRLGYFATRQTGRQYVDFSKLRIVEVSPVPRPHRVCIPSDPTWVINELHARQPQAGHPGDSYTEDEVKCTVNNLYAQIAIPRRSQWNPQPKAKGVESVICRQHPEVAIAHAMLNFYSLVGRPNSGIWIFIGTSNDSCVMCRRYLDLLEQECSPPLPEYPLKPAPQKRPVYFVLSKYSQRPLGWKMPEGASEEIVERINLGLKQDLDKIVLRLRNDWGYRKRKPKPAAVSLEGGDEDVVACMRRKTQEARIRMERLGFKSMSRPSGVGRFRIWGIEDLLEAGEEGEEAGGVGEAGKVDERREIRKADEEEIGETCEEEDIAIGKREPEVREEESVAAGVGRGGE
ncbi:hypothetical protein EV426DRAFT_377757 [Tirmania nivea]|nr:hypothetical protein EV426DRAFT_377757 [Tirmania nivea]